MKVLLIIGGILLLGLVIAVAVFVVRLLYGVATCAEVQEESLDR